MKVEGNRKEGGQSIVPTSGLTFGLQRTVSWPGAWGGWLYGAEVG